MASELRCVCDTNVVVSAVLFPDSVPGQAFLAAFKKGKVLSSEATLLELSEVLGRDKFDRYVLREEREQFLSLLIRDAEMVEIQEHVRECRDPKDDKFLEAAVNGAASHLVTGDQDLLALDPFRGIQILTPAQFVASMSQSE